MVATTACLSQTLKITDVNCSDEKDFKQANENALGKNMVLTIYDKTVKVVIPKSKPMFLSKSSDDQYYGVTDDTKSEIWTANLIINTTLGIITSAKLIVTVTPKRGSFSFNYTESCTLTAKRF